MESDGQLKMIISNEARQHPGIVNGKLIPREDTRPPGILFFNHKGDEMGGLVYGENGEEGHFGSFTWDKYRGDQTIGFRYLESADGKSLNGIQFWQQPKLSSDVLAVKYDSLRLLKMTA